MIQGHASGTGPSGRLLGSAVADTPASSFITNLVGSFFVWLSFTLDDSKKLQMCIGKKETSYLPLVLGTPYL